jgi:putative heme iron utilization protein
LARSLSLVARHDSAARARALRIAAWVLVAVFVSAELLIAVFDRVDGNLCASNRLRALVQWELARQPDLPLDALAREFHTSIAVVLDGTMPERRVGVPGEELPAVWRLVDSWPDPVIVLWGRGHSLEVHGAIVRAPTAAPDDSLHFETAGGAARGKLQASELGAIYAFSARIGDYSVPELLFIDRTGNVIFEIVPGAALRQPLRAAPADASATLRQMQFLPQVCRRARG